MCVYADELVAPRAEGHAALAEAPAIIKSNQEIVTRIYVCVYVYMYIHIVV